MGRKIDEKRRQSALIKGPENAEKRGRLSEFASELEVCRKRFSPKLPRCAASARNACGAHGTGMGNARRILPRHEHFAKNENQINLNDFPNNYHVFCKIAYF